MLTRRTTQRLFLLKPDKTTYDNFIYCFAVAAQRHNIDVHWLMVMSNHYHNGVTDPLGKVPDFLRDFHSLLARCMNHARGRWENFWSTESTGILHLESADDLFDKMVYGLVNPCAANLVEKVCHWPGVSSYESMLTGKPLKVKRPKTFFSSNNKDLPSEVELRFVRPPQFEYLSEQSWRAKVKSAVERREKELLEKREKEGARLVGRKAVRRQSPTAQPKAAAKRRKLNPRVGAKNKWLRVEALRRCKLFLTRYRVALERYLTGEKSVLFPHGTFQLMRLGHVRVEPPPGTA